MKRLEASPRGKVQQNQPGLGINPVSRISPPASPMSTGVGSPFGCFELGAAKTTHILTNYRTRGQAIVGTAAVTRGPTRTSNTNSTFAAPGLGSIWILLTSLLCVTRRCAQTRKFVRGAALLPRKTET